MTLTHNKHVNEYAVISQMGFIDTEILLMFWAKTIMDFDGLLWSESVFSNSMISAYWMLKTKGETYYARRK